SAAGQGGRGVGESLILKRRQRETHLASYVDCVKGLTKANSRAEWEHSLHTRTEGTQVQRTLHHLKNQHESQLHSRRLRLAELYNSEMEAWKEECLANVETPEDRKQKESCDDCRVEDSRKVQTYVLQDRDKQLDERKRLQEGERAFEARMVQLWEEDRLKKEERDRMDREMVIKRNEEVKAILDLQVDLCRKSKSEEEAHKKAEDRALLDEWHRLRQVEEELELQNKQNEINRAIDVKTFNQERVEASRYAAERERQYDMRLLELALAQESDAQRREREQQEKFKQEQLEYQRILRKQMDAEAEDMTYLDRIRKDMEDQVWAKRDAQHNAEEAARQELLRQVLISRTNQTELKQKNQMQKKHEDAAYMEQIKRETEEALQKELREQEERRAELKRNQSDLVKQLEERRIADEQKRQAEYLEFKRMQLAEKQHKERVQQFATNAPPMTYRRKTAQWYFDA
uniref:Cilia- and flagella-associated protein 53 n=1 Tax=Globisporangium ultimum (strain ATCC 200006 / CBS 805.95 / DAOM BR144) TaxID=431595 RepID=K3W7P2_GLOUD